MHITMEVTLHIAIEVTDHIAEVVPGFNKVVG